MNLELIRGNWLSFQRQQWIKFYLKKKGVNIAVGVQYVKNGVSQRSYARKGIIVSAGQFSSVILQRSGIGRPEDLAKAGISTLVESPQVGYNFQTHYSVGMGIRVETGRLLQILALILISQEHLEHLKSQ